MELSNKKPSKRMFSTGLWTPLERFFFLLSKSGESQNRLAINKVIGQNAGWSTKNLFFNRNFRYWGCITSCMNIYLLYSTRPTIWARLRPKCMQKFFLFHSVIVHTVSGSVCESTFNHVRKSTRLPVDWSRNFFNFI